MSNTLLGICQTAAEEVIFNAPAAIISNQDPDGILLKRLATQTCKELVKHYTWQDLKREHSFVTTSATAYDLPADMLKPVDLTFWDQTGARPLHVVSDITWQRLKSGITVSGIRFWFQQQNNQLHLHPAPSEGLTLVFNYYTKNFAERAADGTGISEFEADTDIVRLDEDLVSCGIKYKFAYRKGLPYAEHKADYVYLIDTLQANDVPHGKIDVSGVAGFRYTNLPDGDF